MNSRLRTSLAAMSAARAPLDASQPTYDAALVAYRRGLGSSTDVLTAERQLIEARDAKADAHSNRAFSSIHVGSRLRQPWFCTGLIPEFSPVRRPQAPSDLRKSLH